MIEYPTMLSPNFHTFYSNWRRKSDEYLRDDLESAFDHFFTLFVIYNRLYAETTFLLARRNEIDLNEKRPFPDSKAAKIYVRMFLGDDNLIEQLESDQDSREAISAVKALLDGPDRDGHQFSIKLDMIRGDPMPDKDHELLCKLRSDNHIEKATAILEFVYAIRCNLFHGHKGFDSIQMEVMRPANTLLSKISEILFNRLNESSS